MSAEAAEVQPGRFEELVARLEQIVKRLEGGGTSLDEAVALFREGRSLAAEAQQLLDAAEAAVNGVTGAEAVAWLPESGGGKS